MTATALQITATYNMYEGPAAVQGVEVSARTATHEDAIALAALFPKSLRIRATTLSCDPEYSGYFRFNVTLAPNKAFGAVNETGLARYRSLLRAAAKAGIAVEYRPTYQNAYRTVEEFHSVVGI